MLTVGRHYKEKKVQQHFSISNPRALRKRSPRWWSTPVDKRKRGTVCDIAHVKTIWCSQLGPVVRSLVSANRWSRGIKTYRFPWYLTLVSTNHASSNPGLIAKNKTSLLKFNFMYIYLGCRFVKYLSIPGRTASSLRVYTTADAGHQFRKFVSLIWIFFIQ